MLRTSDPQSLSPPSEDALLEEGRLLYVAMTRAKRRLYLLHSRKSTHFGKQDDGGNEPSRFLERLEGLEGVRHVDVEPEEDHEQQFVYHGRHARWEQQGRLPGAWAKQLPAGGARHRTARWASPAERAKL
jgi:ATP-dependent exoDNAse (exonuclease V) beta subunit